MNWRRVVAGAAIGLLPTATVTAAFRKEGLNTNLLGTEQPHTHVELERTDGTMWAWGVRASPFSGAIVQLWRISSEWIS